MKKGLPFPLKLPHPCQKLLTGLPARSRVAQAVRDSPSPGMMREKGKVRHEGKEWGRPGKRCVALPPRMGCATRHGRTVWAAPFRRTIRYVAGHRFFGPPAQQGQSPHKGDWPCFFICPSDAVPDVPQRIGTVYGLGYWRICEKMLPSRSSPCWAALAYQRADSVASCGTPKPTS